MRSKTDIRNFIAHMGRGTWKVLRYLLFWAAFVGTGAGTIFLVLWIAQSTLRLAIAGGALFLLIVYWAGYED